MTALPPSKWQVRKCSCSFCSTHEGHLHVSDPLGQVSYFFAQITHLSRYRFSTKTADFLTCLNCGSYLGAVTDTQKGKIAVINAEIIDLELKLPEARPVSFDGESILRRQIRRCARWTPVINDKILFF